MDQSLSAYRDRILRIRPGLALQSIELNTEGLINDVVVVNKETVFRFAKGEQGMSALQSEIKVLQKLEGHLTLSVPQPTYIDDEVIAYDYIVGDSLTRRALAELSPSDRDRLIDQLALCLRELHGISVSPDLPETRAPVTLQAWNEIRQEVEERIYPLLLPHQVDWAENLFETTLTQKALFQHESRVIHGDLAPYHILFRPEPPKLSGVIDFGVAGLGDPANDLAMLLQNYGESVVEGIFRVYPEARRHMKRARFYAQAIELEWVLMGLKTGDRFWFTAHIGAPRDVKD